MDSPAILSLHELSVAFGGVRAVHALSFDVRPRSIVALIGPNGAGKTTALNAISGFVRASGSVRYRGTELLRKPAHARASLGIGRTFQNLQLFRGMTLLENVVTGRHTTLGGNLLLDMLWFPVAGREREARDRAMAILQTLRIDGYASAAVEGLPFGIQKLAGVARALAVDADLLLLDEPAAGLNRSEVDAFGDLVQRLRDERGITVVLVEHNMRLVMGISDTIVVLDQGEKLMEGSPDAVRDDPRVIEAYLGAVEDHEIVHKVHDEFAERS
jgi:branched-chain amino acid transport system ATP-binding protein